MPEWGIYRSLRRRRSTSVRRRADVGQHEEEGASLGAVEPTARAESATAVLF